MDENHNISNLNELFGNPSDFIRNNVDGFCVEKIFALENNQCIFAGDAVICNEVKISRTLVKTQNKVAIEYQVGLGKNSKQKTIIRL